MAVVITPVSAADARGVASPAARRVPPTVSVVPARSACTFAGRMSMCSINGLGAGAAGTAEPAADLLIPRLPTFALSSPLWDTAPGAILRHLQVVAGTMRLFQ